jgi:DNA-binding SARP family transcriptional activator/predicted ATPase
MYSSPGWGHPSHCDILRRLIWLLITRAWGINIIAIGKDFLYNALGGKILVYLLKLNLFGMFQANREGEPSAEFESDKVRALLAYLATEHSRFHARESLGGLFWPESPEQRARRNLSQALYNLRQGLGLPENNPVLQTTSHQVGFFPGKQVFVDVLAFDELVQDCDEHTHRLVSACQVCLLRLEQAARIYRGEYLTGLVLQGCNAFEYWQTEQRQARLEKARQVFSWLAQAKANTGETELACDFARRRVDLDPFNEAAVRQWMDMLRRSGQRNEALLAYQQLKQRLASELGVAPDAETTQLYQRIRQGKDTAPYTPPNNLPAILTPFIGRKAELDDLYLKLSDPTCRLVTLLGPGGIGKTRLAQEAGRALLGAYPGGVFALEMSELGSSEAILPTIAILVGFTQGSSYKPAELRDGKDLENELYEYLASKEMLLILDSFEMVLAGAVPVVHNLLVHVPGLRVVATSQARLNLKYEHLIPVTGLDIAPDVDDPERASAYSAVQLFTTAARRADSHFRLTQHNLPVIIRICQAVEGTPLLILLAAAWLSLMSVDEIASRLQAGLDFLASEWRDLPARHRSLRATLEQSWSLLAPPEQAAFRRLAVFKQAFTQEQALQICQVSSDQLCSLQEYSLLQSQTPNRYRMHDLLHHFALEKLQSDPVEMAGIMELFSAYYMRKLAAWNAGLTTKQVATILAEMGEEIENIRQAWDLALLGARYAELQAGIPTLGWYYICCSSFREGVDLCQQGVEEIHQAGLSEHNLRLWARLMTWKAIFIYNLEHPDEANAGFEQVIEVLQRPEWAGLDTRFEQAFAMRYLGNLLRYKDKRRGLELVQRSLDFFRQMGNGWYVAQALFSLAQLHEDLGQSIVQLRLLEEALEILGPDGDPFMRNNLLDFLGLTYLALGDFEAGVPIFRESLSSRLESGDELQIAVASERLVVGLFWSGEYQEAYDRQSQALEVLERYRVQPQPLTPMVRAALCTFLGKYGEAQDQMMDIHQKPFAHLVSLLTGSILLAQKRYLPAIRLLEESGESSRKLPDRRILGLNLTFLSLARYFAGDGSAARLALLEALQAGLAHRMVVGVQAALAAAALMLAEAGWLEAAAEVLAGALAHPTSANSVLLADVAVHRTRQKIASLSPAVRAAAERRGQSADPYDVLVRLLDCLRQEPTLQEGLARCAESTKRKNILERNPDYL